MAIRKSCSWKSGTPSVRFRIGSSEGCRYDGASSPARRRRYGWTIPPTYNEYNFVAAFAVASLLTLLALLTLVLKVALEWRSKRAQRALGG